MYPWYFIVLQIFVECINFFTINDMKLENKIDLGEVVYLYKGVLVIIISDFKS